MLYVPLDVNWPDNHKIIDAGIEGAGLHAIVLCLAKRLEADGWVRRRLLHRQGATDELIDRLIALGLLDAEGDSVRPHGWLDRNPSQAAIAARRASKAEAGKKGNHDRWQHPFPFDECPKCHVLAECDPTGSDRIAEHRTPTKQSEAEVGTAIPSAMLDHPPTPKIPEPSKRLAEDQIAQIKAQHFRLIPGDGSNPNHAAGVGADRPVAVSCEAQV